MLQLAFILVVLSGLLNATWNLFTKRSKDKVVFLWLLHAIAAVVYMPAFLYGLFTAGVAAEGIGVIAVSFLFHAAYISLLAKTYTIGDLSQVYPLMRGIGAMLVPIIGVVFLGEHVAVVGWMGIAILLAGIFIQSRNGKAAPLGSAAGGMLPVLFACGIGLCITGYTIVDKLAVQHISPLALIQLQHLAYILALGWKALRSGNMRSEWSINWKTILIGSVIAPGSYLLFLFAMSLGEVAKLGPIRESGIVFGTLFGILFLKEKQGLMRIVGAVMITAGVVLLRIWG